LYLIAVTVLTIKPIAVLRNLMQNNYKLVEAWSVECRSSLLYFSMWKS